MLQRWTDHNGLEHKELDDYLRNVTLVDLKQQPEHIKKIISETVINSCVPKNLPMIGAQFLKFCGKYELNKLSENASAYGEILSKEYPCG